MMLVVFEVAVLVGLVLHCLRKYTRFSAHSVKHGWPIPFLGNFGPVATRRRHFSEIITDTYNAYPEDRFAGTYEFMSPLIVVRDIELIKKIAIQDFDYFLGHRRLINEDVDPLFARGIVFLKGPEWKDMRSILSPAFASAKTKNMLPSFIQKSENLANIIKNDIEASDSKFIDMDIKVLANRFVVDAVATAYFGKSVDSFSEPENMFYKMCRTATTIDFKTIMKFLGCHACPNMMKLFNVAFFTSDVKAYFKQLVLGMIYVIKVDKDGLIYMLKKAHKEGWSDTDLIAQALFLLVTALNTVGTATSFVLYELACNPEVQSKLVQEIRKHKSGDKFDNSAIENMPYLDMVVSETLRLWPPIPVNDRICSKNYDMGKPNDKSKEGFTVREGEDVVIPIFAIHRDPQYFPDPLKFDPERFSEENKHNIKPHTYMPFGFGMRQCLGISLAKCIVKSLLVNLIDVIEVVPYEKTTIPAKICTNHFALTQKGGYWLRLKIRKTE